MPIHGRISRLERQLIEGSKRAAVELIELLQRVHSRRKERGKPTPQGAFNSVMIMAGARRKRSREKGAERWGLDPQHEWTTFLLKAYSRLIDWKRKPQLSADPWQRKCATWAKVLFLRNKDEVAFKGKRFTEYTTETWESSLARMQNQLTYDVRAAGRSVWEVWSETVSTNLRKRSNGRYKHNQCKTERHHGEDRTTAIQMSLFE